MAPARRRRCSIPLYRGARVALFARGSVDTFKTATSNTFGVALFTQVPLGQYRVAVVPSSIGDSIEVQAITVGVVDTNVVRVTFAEDTTVVQGRLGYPEFSVREARSLPLGRRVFIRGVILSGVQSFRDTTSHVTDSSLADRLTRVALKGGLSGNNPGDSVSVLGVTVEPGGAADARQLRHLQVRYPAGADPAAGQHRYREDRQ